MRGNPDRLGWSSAKTEKTSQNQMNQMQTVYSSTQNSHTSPTEQHLPKEEEGPLTPPLPQPNRQ